jgi:hypothetical protein
MDERNRRLEKVMHNVELRNLYSSPNVIKIIKLKRTDWVGHAAGMSENRNVYTILVGKPEAKKPLGRYGRRYNDNNKKSLRELG